VELLVALLVSGAIGGVVLFLWIWGGKAEARERRRRHEELEIEERLDEHGRTRRKKRS
jgi:hypothetical protein